MFAGLPGTGIAGLLYFGMAVATPFRWLYRLARGRARPGEGRLALRLVALVSAAVGALWLEAAALEAVVERVRVSGGALAPALPGKEVAASYAVPLALTGVVTLALVLLLVQALRLFLPRRACAALPPRPTS